MSMKSVIFILLSVCSFLSLTSKAQSKCDSVMVIKVYDSASHKPLRRVFIDLSYGGRYSRASRTNRRGIARLNFSSSDKLDLKNKAYEFKVFLVGYDYKKHIPLSLDCNCVQKVYLRKWTIEEQARIVR